MADRVDVDGLETKLLATQEAIRQEIPLHVERVTDWLGDAVATLRSQRSILEVIAERGCGIPGHAVAVGCGSNVIARKALDGEYVQPCPDCHGHAFRWKVEPNPSGTDEMVRVPCETCDRKGLVPAPTPSSEEKP